MSIKLIALDLDGTLLNGKKEISEVNKKALQEARQQGVKVVITTGRPLPAVEAFLRELDLMHPDEYSITFNGGLVQTNDGGILDHIGFGMDEVEKLYKITRELNLPLDIVHGGDVYVIPSALESLYPKLNVVLNYIPTKYEDLPKDIEYNKAVTACDVEYLDEQIAKIPAELQEQFEIFKSRDVLLEWSPKGVHKSEGLAKLIKHLDIQQTEVMACGDEENDLSMIEWAGLGVCMANGSDPVKAVANVVTPMTNEEDAVAWAIRKYVLSED
ncbi:HAD superfamily hydrolase [Streptococcus varani]|uniref:HAD superfamily hydrolase n=1 Tax=Streptococcus varani TaxID=1608583 RepID=A0A0E4CTB6_9STRE|nr:Cof-type HAD-IIB family hydrolase [Streptococcus varani]CQR25534.1 HAD superfamily hydrolase [Streptococcus varani]